MTDELLAALTAAPPRDKRIGCYFSSWLEDQTPDRQEAVKQAMANERWTTAALHALFASEGYEKQYNTLRSHRAGGCSCADV